MKVAYFYCACGRGRKEMINLLRAEGYNIKLVQRDPIAAKQARQYGLRLPIKVTNGVAERI